MMMRLTLFLLALLTGFNLVNSYPGETHDQAAVEAGIALHKRHAAHIAAGLQRCESNSLYAKLKARALERRRAKARSLRISRGLPLNAVYKTRRDSTALTQFGALNHNFTSSNTTMFTPPATLFESYSNASCILTPEVTEGPYYVSGEHIRQNVIESQEGVPIFLEYQYIDISTCSPATGLWVDSWHANSTGVYSGVVANGNGDSSDATNLNNTFLRGVQPVDWEGVAIFETLVPGHYSGRTNHIHLAAHQNGSVLTNGTYGGGYVSHVGQIFFPEDLLLAVEATSPYNTNTQTRTTNDEDSIAAQQADNNYDPFPSYAYLGDSVTDGLLMWISVGIDMSYNYSINAAATLTSKGGVANANSMGGGGGIGGNSTMGGNGTLPSGGMSGFAPSGTAMPSGASFVPSGSGVPSVTISGSLTAETTATASGA